MSNNEKNSDGNYNFVQLSRTYLKDMRVLARKSPLGHEILYYLVENMGRTTNAVVVSYRTLEEVTSTSRSSVARAVKILRDDNWMETVKVGSATAYCVNARAFWQAGRNQKQYAIFSATVVASSEEQGDDFREKATHDLKYIPMVKKDERIQINTNEVLPPPDQTEIDLD
ncbi:plasmid replication initiation protein [Pseudoalteromonas distincta]|nr:MULTISPECIES: replication/maintenance protein RepL [Pseudoalteromonas]MBE0422194.1 replication/maintenance protein RepL [Pseudoalteromonas nigrifaciens]TVU67466.1 plasmid replication initiation protein [Pseudoalteromonas elyakovii]